MLHSMAIVLYHVVQYGGIFLSAKGMWHGQTPYAGHRVRVSDNSDTRVAMTFHQDTAVANDLGRDQLALTTSRFARRSHQKRR